MRLGSAWAIGLMLIGCEVEGEPLGEDDDTVAILGNACDRAESLLDRCVGAPATETPLDAPCDGRQRCVAQCALDAHASGGCGALTDTNAAYLQCTTACGTAVP